MNEAAFDPQNDLLPSLGQNMATYNILTDSIIRQSQMKENRDFESVATMAPLHATSQDSGVESGGSAHKEEIGTAKPVVLWENDTKQASAISR